MQREAPENYFSIVGSRWVLILDIYKSLTELLQQDDEELKMANRKGRAIKSVMENHKDVNIGSTEWQMVNGNKNGKIIGKEK
jgi:hypothetical protein